MTFLIVLCSLSLFVDCEPALPILFGTWTAHLLTPIRNMTQPIYPHWWFNITIENHNFHGTADHLKMTIFRGSRDWKQDDYSVSIETLKNSCVIRAWLLGDGMWWKVAEDRKQLPNATRNSLDWPKSLYSFMYCIYFCCLSVNLLIIKYQSKKLLTCSLSTYGRFHECPHVCLPYIFSPAVHFMFFPYL